MRHCTQPQVRTSVCERVRVHGLCVVDQGALDRVYWYILLLKQFMCVKDYNIMNSD